MNIIEMHRTANKINEFSKKMYLRFNSINKEFNYKNMFADTTNQIEMPDILDYLIVQLNSNVSFRNDYIKILLSEFGYIDDYNHCYDDLISRGVKFVDSIIQHGVYNVLISDSIQMSDDENIFLILSCVDILKILDIFEELDKLEIKYLDEIDQYIID